VAGIAHWVTVNGTVIRFNKGSALLLNQTFPQPASSYDASKESTFTGPST
jgi:hypothetical protein